MPAESTRFSVRLATRPEVFGFTLGDSTYSGNVTRFRGNLPFSHEDFGKLQIGCIVNLVILGEGPDLSDGDYFAIAKREPGEFFSRHKTDQMVGRLLLRANLEPWTDEEYGELGPAAEAWILLSKDDWRNLLASLAAIPGQSGISVQFDINCKTYHPDGTLAGLDTTKLVIPEDEEYPIIGVEISVSARES
ncbi:MAG: hypothetical protein COB40_03950 [Marinosulfonomonas sp.]|nr:MAG: hypothetical protein COB40_03950 [Marinosulfonomonas sp.]